MIGFDIGQVEEKGSADVAADVGGVFLSEHLAQQSGCCRFAFGPGDAGDGSGAALDEQANFGGDGDIAPAGQLQIGGFWRHSGRGDDQVGVGEVGFLMAAEVEGDGEVFELILRLRQSIFGGFVGH